MPQISQLPMVFASQLFWLAVAFGIIFFGVGRGMLPKIRSTMSARNKKVDDDLVKAKAARTAAEETEAAWRERMDQARQESARIAQKAKQESAREIEATVKAAMDEIDAKVERSRLRIRDMVGAARAEMEMVAADAAQQMVERLTGLKIDRDEAAKAVAAELELLRATSGSEQATPRPVELPRAKVV